MSSPDRVTPQIRINDHVQDDGLLHSVAMYGELESACGKLVHRGSSGFGSDGMPEGAQGDACPDCVAENLSFIALHRHAVEGLGQEPDA